MNYTASVSDYFKSPAWVKNCLLGGVCVLIPVIGQLVLSGWLITGLWARGNDDNPATFPRFEFENFGKYLERGLWPFLVSLVASFLLVPFIMAMVFGSLFMSGAFSQHTHHGNPETFPFLLMIVMFVVEPILIIGFNFLLIPLMLRATITQDFKASFDFGFMKNFLSLVWKEMVGTCLFLMVLGIGMMIVTIITCYIGLFFAAPVVSYAWHHLQKQLYQAYLARGGQPVPLSAKLLDTPPPLPAV